MRFLQVLLLATNVLSRKLFTKTIYTPVCDVGDICSIHHVILFKKTPFVDGENRFSEVYAADFSPTDDITEPGNAWRIFTGEKIKGKVRVFHFDQIDYDDLLREPVHQWPTCPIHSLQEWDPELYNKIVGWSPVFQLYTRNCQHFGRYLCS